ncbi:MAG: YfiR family protein [Planctomycetia bacterium]|nr:YfiR family protein [Planctomycetia bacterium]
MAARLPVWLLLLGALVLAVKLPAARAQPAAADEHVLKAAYLRTFGQYTVWPKAAVPGDRFVIGVLGKNQFKAVVEILEKQEVSGRKVEVKEFKTMQDYRPCHLLFISSEPAGNNPKEQPGDRLASALAALKQQPVLLVADTPGLAGRGAMLNLYLEKGTVRYEINVEAIKAVGLTPKADLQKYGKPVSADKK